MGTLNEWSQAIAGVSPRLPASYLVPSGTLSSISAMRTGVYNRQALGPSPLGFRESATKPLTPSSPTGARRWCRRRRPILTSSSSSSNDKSSTSQKSLDTLDLLLNSGDPSPGVLTLLVHCFIAAKQSSCYAHQVMVLYLNCACCRKCFATWMLIWYLL